MGIEDKLLSSDSNGSTNQDLLGSPAPLRYTTYVLMTVLAMAGVHLGYYISIFNPMGDPLLITVYGKTPAEKKDILGNINMIFCIGAFFSVIVGGRLSEKFGRRAMVYFYEGLSVATCLLYAVKSLEVLMLARFLSGWIAAAGVITAAVCMTEILPKRLNGMGGAVMYLFVVTFIFVAYVSQNVLSRDQLVEYWREVLSWPVAVSILRLLILPLFFKTDTPKFYISKHFLIQERATLRNSIMSIYSNTYNPKEVEAITDKLIELHVQQSMAKELSIRGMLKTPHGRRRLAAGLFASAAQMLSGNALIVYYSTDLFNRISGNGKHITLAIAISKIPAGLLGMLFVKYFGRKKNLEFGIFAQGICLGLIALSSSEEISILAYLGVFGYVMAFAVGIGGGLNIYVSEILPPVGVGLAMSLNWLINGLLAKILPLISDSFGDENTLLLFFGLCLMCAGVMDMLLVETRNKTEDQIIQDYKNRSNHCCNFK